MASEPYLPPASAVRVIKQSFPSVCIGVGRPARLGGCDASRSAVSQHQYMNGYIIRIFMGSGGQSPQKLSDFEQNFETLAQTLFETMVFGDYYFYLNSVKYWVVGGGKPHSHLPLSKYWVPTPMVCVYVTSVLRQKDYGTRHAGGV